MGGSWHDKQTMDHRRQSQDNHGVTHDQCRHCRDLPQARTLAQYILSVAGEVLRWRQDGPSQRSGCRYREDSPEGECNTQDACWRDHPGQRRFKKNVGGEEKMMAARQLNQQDMSLNKALRWCGVSIHGRGARGTLPGTRSPRGRIRAADTEAEAEGYGKVPLFGQGWKTYSQDAVHRERSRPDHPQH